ncbi:unnamed protein product [Adineta steineri]|uniref:Fungal lipase-type domain-containing protein n=1 Tax=Adineta steineri TaxID=433720 RepID=A0A819JRY2_9BILA|nr:unnamed protein product [Adineta steineri]
MEICNWQIANLNIQDMVLFATLAYKPVDNVKQELNAFYNDTNLNFTLVESLSQYYAIGYGNVTYYTLTTNNVVIVAIRGTALNYEAFVNGDIWIESAVYQLISLLFPWSKLFPDYISSRIIRHMSIIDRLAQNGEQHRLYVQKVIDVLKKVDQVYGKTHTFIVVGHSLGGGLAKLAGIALNTTDALVSISGPGITYTHAKLYETSHVDMQSINRRTVNLYNDRDVVPWIDKKEGLIQLITCPKTFSNLQCHSMPPILCNVIKMCGNTRQFRVDKNICMPK